VLVSELTQPSQRSQTLASELRSTVADDDIAISSVADRCLLSGVKQESHFLVRWDLFHDDS
jgi:hypothetical protein